MKLRVFIILILMSISPFAHAQKKLDEMSVSVGVSSYAGDVGGGLSGYYALENLGFGFGYKRFVKPMFSFRSNISILSFTSRDYDSPNTALKKRNYSIFNTIFEFFLGGEFNFFEFNPYSAYNKNKRLTPYLSTGIALINYQLKSINNARVVYSEGFDFSFSIPLILGVKTKINNHSIIFLESKSAYTFTDNIDYNYVESKSFKNSNDWYFSLNIGFSYILDKYKCFCLPPLEKEREELDLIKNGEKPDEEENNSDSKVSKKKEKQRKKNARKSRKK